MMGQPVHDAERHAGLRALQIAQESGRDVDRRSHLGQRLAALQAQGPQVLSGGARLGSLADAGGAGEQALAPQLIDDRGRIEPLGAAQIDGAAKQLDVLFRIEPVRPFLGGLAAQAEPLPGANHGGGDAELFCDGANALWLDGFLRRAGLRLTAQGFCFHASFLRNKQSGFNPARSPIAKGTRAAGQAAQCFHRALGRCRSATTLI